MQANAQVFLRLTDERADLSTLQDITQRLANRLDCERDISASVPNVASVLGKKGDLVTLGTIVLSLIGSGGVVVTLLNVLRSYVEQVPELKIDLEKNGNKVSLSAHNFKDLNQTQEIINKFFGS